MEGLEVIEVARCYDVERVSSFIWQRGGRRSKEIIMCFIMLKGAFGSIKRKKEETRRENPKSMERRHHTQRSASNAHLQQHY